MATKIETTATPVVKAEKVKKDPIPAHVRITKTLKNEAVRGKLTADELDKISQLALGLKAFIAA